MPKPTQRQIDASNTETVSQLLFELRKEFWFLTDLYYSDHEGLWCATYADPAAFEQEQFDTFAEAIASWRKHPVRIVAGQREIYSDRLHSYSILYGDTPERRQAEIGQLLRNYPIQGYGTTIKDQWEKDGMYFAFASYYKSCD